MMEHSQRPTANLSSRLRLCELCPHRVRLTRASHEISHRVQPDGAIQCGECIAFVGTGAASRSYSQPKAQHACSLQEAPPVDLRLESRHSPSMLSRLIG